MSSNNKPAGPLGGWFGTIGGILGLALGIDIGSWVGAIIGLFAGAYVGLAVERVVYKLLLFAAAVLIFLIRREMLSAILEGLSN